MTNIFEEALQESQRTKRGSLIREWLEVLDADRASQLQEALANSRYSPQLIAKVLHRWKEEDESLPRAPGIKAVTSARPANVT